MAAPGTVEAWTGPLDRLLALVVLLRNPRRMVAAAVVVLGAGVALAAVLIDLSPLDPFGPGLGWSPGVLLIAAFGAFLLLRSRREEE